MPYPQYFEPDPQIPDSDLLGYGDLVFDDGSRQFIDGDPELVSQFEVKPFENSPQIGQGQPPPPDFMQQTAQLQAPDGRSLRIDLDDPQQPLKELDPLAGNSLAMPAPMNDVGAGDMGIQSVGTPVRPDGSSMGQQMPDFMQQTAQLQAPDGRSLRIDLDDPQQPLKPVDDDGLQLVGRDGALPADMAARQSGEMVAAQNEQIAAEMQAREDELRITREANAKRMGELEAERAEVQRQQDEQAAKVERLEKETKTLAETDIERDGFSAYANNPLSAAMAILGAALGGATGSDAGLRMIENKINKHIEVQLNRRNSMLNQLNDQLGSAKQGVAGYKAKLYELMDKSATQQAQATKADVFEAQNPAILEGLQKKALAERQKFDEEAMGKRIERIPDAPKPVDRMSREGYGKAAADQSQAEKDTIRALDAVGGKWDPTTGKITNRKEVEDNMKGVGIGTTFMRDLGNLPFGLGALPQATDRAVTSQKGLDTQAALEALVSTEAVRQNPGRAPTDADREAARKSLGLESEKGVVDALERMLGGFEAQRRANVSIYGEQAAGAVEGTMERAGGRSTGRMQTPQEGNPLAPGRAREQLQQERAKPTSSTEELAPPERMAQLSADLQQVAGEELSPDGIAILLAQSGHETNDGKSAPQNNFFGHKATRGRPGNSYMTTEGEGAGAKRVRQAFGKFESSAESAAAHVSLLKRRYPDAWEALQAGDVAAYVAALKDGGYFTGNETGYLNGILERL